MLNKLPQQTEKNSFYDQFLWYIDHIYLLHSFKHKINNNTHTHTHTCANIYIQFPFFTNNYYYIQNPLQLKLNLSQNDRVDCYFFIFKHIKNMLFYFFVVILLFTPILYPMKRLILLWFHYFTLHSHMSRDTHWCYYNITKLYTMFYTRWCLIKETSFYYYILYVQGQFISCRVVSMDRHPRCRRDSLAFLCLCR